MIENPFLPSPPDAAAWAEGFLKGLTRSADTSASGTVDQQSMAAFLKGIQAGEDAAANGLSVGSECVSAAESESSETPSIAFEGLSIAKEAVFGSKLLGHALSGLFVLAIELAVTLPHRAEDPATVLPQIGSALVDDLNAMGVAPTELFVGAAVDPLADGCEIKLTAMYITPAQAREAVTAMGRSVWIVGGWRTDQSNSFRVVDESVS